ncbi:MAG: CheY-like chemotaxis protein [Bradymonadia bacterium]
MSAPSILVVDSDGEHAAACLSFLEDSGFSVTVARDLRGAEAGLEAQPEILLLDAILNGTGTEALARSATERGANVFGMSDVFVGDTNRDIAIGLHGCVDFWEKPVAPDSALEWFRRVLGDRFPAPGTGAEGGLTVGAEAALGEGEQWGNRPTNVTPVEGEPVVEAAKAAPLQDLEEEAEDLGATPLPAGESSYNATTRVATAQELASGMRAEDATPLPSDSGATGTPRSGSGSVSASGENGEPYPGGTRVDDTPSASVIVPRQALASSSDDHVVFARSPSQSVLPGSGSASEPEVDIPSLFDASGTPKMGSFGDTTFAAVLAAELGKGATGVLMVERSGVKKEFFIAGGDVVGLRSDAPEDTLGAIMLSDGLIRGDQAAAITRNLGADALSVPETYVDTNAIEVEDIPALEAFLVRRRAHEVFAWTEGEWSVSNQRCPSSVRASESVSGSRLLRDGVMHGADTETIRRALGPQLRCPILWTGARPTELLGWQAVIVDRIDGVARTSSVILGAPGRDEALRFIATLAIERRIGFVP